ncbi:MAG TPA: NADH dehydrogenase ubiquinone Fe-S protein 4 [Allosphingosinicella sp.]|nr:NADH dehydrogenase ubiquinone Fe-S protein 4 [Allosphingosinicella sp.]
MEREDAERRYRLAAFPPGTRVLIRRRERPVNQIGRAREGEWLLRFDPQSRLFVDPLTGWTGGSDALRHVELSFATLEQAIRYSERHALPYRISAAMLGGPALPQVKEALHEQAA